MCPQPAVLILQEKGVDVCLASQAAVIVRVVQTIENGFSEDGLVC